MDDIAYIYAYSNVYIHTAQYVCTKSGYFFISFFPDYYKFIDSPMDLTTLKSKISSYDSVQELIRDFRLIWSNCKAFNAEGSDIYNTADELAAIAESNIEVPT